jgi:5-formyltetrahydrofolate cyclo-ligase
MATPDPHKQLLRKTLIEQRAAMPRPELLACSYALTQHLLAHPIWLAARGLSAFVGVRGEVDTEPLLKRSIAAGKRVWLPRLTTPGMMAFWPCDDLTQLQLGRMGLREPPIVGEGVQAPGPDQEVDLILVPGLAFGRDGARLGFGAGHYDRAFAAWHTLPIDARARLCGVCPASFLDPSGGPIPMLEHDLKMDYIATDEGVFAVE